MGGPAAAGTSAIVGDAAPRPEGVLRRAGQVLAGTPTPSGRGGLLLQGAAQDLGGVPGGTCGAGDSGGPLVTTTPPVLVGVVSSAVAGAATCWSSRVDTGPYRTWLDQLIAQPGARLGDARGPATGSGEASAAASPPASVVVVFTP